MYASPSELVNLAHEITNEDSRERKKKHISILKSFIVLQKSNYYLTRKKDKWQIIYITNARPAHMSAPCFTWHSKNKIHLLVFRLLAKTSQDESEGLVVVVFCCDLRLENGTLRYIHSQCSFHPLPVRPAHYSTGRLSTIRGRLTLEQKWSVPLEQGFLNVFSPKLCEFIVTLLDWLI